MSVAYAELTVDRIKEMSSDRILVDWEEKDDFIKVGQNRKALIRPGTHKQQHYTGVVLKVGPDVEDVKIGDRILFEQFSGFEKFDDPEFGRVAIIREIDAVAVVPKRLDVDSAEPDYNFDA